MCSSEINKAVSRSVTGTLLPVHIGFESEVTDKADFVQFMSICHKSSSAMCPCVRME